MSRRIDRQRARAILDELGFDPIRHLVAIARNPNTPLDLQIDACRFMLPHVHARLADVDVSVESNAPIAPTVNITNLLGDAESRHLIEELSLRLTAATRAEQFGAKPKLIEAQPLEEK